MNLRPWVAASLAGAAIALACPPPVVAAQASARHVSGSPWLQEGDGDDDGGDDGGDDGDGGGGGGRYHRNPWRACFSPRRVVLIDQDFRAILNNGRRGPEALVLQRDPTSSSASPTEPWSSFTVVMYLDVKYPTQNINQYVWEIRDFFREHPLFVVKAFDRHERAFRFPAAHCINNRDDDRGDGDRGDHVFPQGGATAGGGGPSGSPSPQGGDHRPNDPRVPQAPAPGSAIRPLPRGAAAGRSARLLSTRHIGIAASGLLMMLGMLATAWLRRRSRRRRYGA